MLEDIPQWCVSHFECDEENAYFAIRCNGKLFYIEVLAEDLGDWSRKQEFLQLLQDVSENFDVDAEESLYDLISEPCISLFRTYSSKAEVLKPFTLQEYYAPEVLFFKLVNDNSTIRAVRCPEDQQKIANFTPQIALKDIPSNSNILSLDASKITIISSDVPDADVASDKPSIVSVDITSSRYYFKAVQDHSSFLRELAILLRLQETRLHKKYRLPTIHSLVHYSNDYNRILGVLLNRIDSDCTLADHIRDNKPSRSLNEKWNSQIRDTVRALHRHGVIWGDVKPENILIDQEHNAWLIDFGGGFNSGYVDKDVMETVDGDWQGVSRIADTLSRWALL
ncbi:MAG: hypothetical protein Q9227_000007 [Pyrenula ochraceoflavens]